MFVYVGDLSEVFEAVSRSLHPTSGLFCFSTEFLKESSVDDDNPSRPYKLHNCARFAHKRSYIEQLSGRVRV